MSIEKTPPENARAKLLKAAAVLFYNNGVGGTGIDAIVERAGVAKKSLYNNFASKADLVNQYLEARHAEWLSLYHARLEHAATAKDRVLAVFDAYQDHAEHEYERGFRGCGLLNAAAELPADDIGRQAVKHHKREVEAILASHFRELLPASPIRSTTLARHTSFLLEGSISRAGLEGNSGCVHDAREIVSDMLEAL
ncbi:TetR/AcrR family transcriptional regulator [Ochrobactrum sp. BTU1]|uniref:TetR/AcrR family transcriptional regulator n=1 Tax=Ochrobactrum sp. BTU1 TaxID=2840456 RepID=UPI001C043123|nr:TetR/AcrR family transcriptional regulator [Ochrobactrum sp. BTU1]